MTIINSRERSPCRGSAWLWPRGCPVWVRFAIIAGPLHPGQHRLDAKALPPGSAGITADLFGVGDSDWYGAANIQLQLHYGVTVQRLLPRTLIGPRLLDTQCQGPLVRQRRYSRFRLPSRLPSPGRLYAIQACTLLRSRPRVSAAIAIHSSKSGPSTSPQRARACPGCPAHTACTLQHRNCSHADSPDQPPTMTLTGSRSTCPRR